MALIDIKRPRVKNKTHNSWKSKFWKNLLFTKYNIYKDNYAKLLNKHLLGKHSFFSSMVSWFQGSLVSWLKPFLWYSILWYNISYKMEWKKCLLFSLIRATGETVHPALSESKFWSVANAGIGWGQRIKTITLK